MSAKLGLSSPWVRAWFPPVIRDSIEEIIPDDHRIVITCDARHRFYTLRGYRGGALVSTFAQIREPVASAQVMAGVLAAEAKANA